eukprot:NODE_1799_length_838_cov_102.894804_g1418_i0.p1 GENE.NODE_1799_length_838_cov_102.894804_g1418_i0~~NODE_1799_length_838_cov_102.894804_g1418_i0.p1  ORF type:complete len:223 (+),score=65.64 NODE_1799_length_838_cov_102.894804_g1418_i0:59-670(+)
MLKWQQKLLSEVQEVGGKGKLPEWFDPKLQQFTRQWRQATPPKGGFPTIRHRYLSPSKGVSMRTAWTLIGAATLYGLYASRMENIFTKDVKDDFQARTQATLPYYLAEIHMKNIIQEHYEHKFHQFVMPDLNLNERQFFHHHVPGAVTAFAQRRVARDVNMVSTNSQMQYPSQARKYDPSTTGVDKWTRMLGFTVHEGPAFPQ